MRRSDWRPDLTSRDVPLFEVIARSIANDIADGKLAPGDHLPPQRTLAKRINLDVTTVARGYAEAARLGLVEARVGAGTFIRASASQDSNVSRRADLADRSMNQPPEVASEELLTRMRRSLSSIADALPQLLRYQPAGGVAQDKAAAHAWLSRRGVVAEHHGVHITAGAHAALSAVLSTLLSPMDRLACESLTYPGVKSIAKTQGIEVIGLPSDTQGVDPQALDAVARLQRVRVLYLNPTLRNPTTETMSVQRRAEIVEVARKHGISIVEDDAYGFLPVNPPPALAMLAPELTFYIAGLAKCLGPGLRLAYLLTPTDRTTEAFVESLRAVSVMASPMTTALATRWIENGLADAVLAYVRAETRSRRRLVLQRLPADVLQTNEYSFHVWVKAPQGWERQRAVDWMRGYALGAVASDAFCVGVPPPQAFRLCLGGAANLEDTKRAIESLAELYR